MLRVREGGGKIKPSEPTTSFSSRKPTEMTQGLGSMIKHSG